MTRWLILQKARRHTVKGAPTARGRAVSGAVSLPLGVLFTFPSRYWFAIGRGRVFSLGGWSPLLRAGFHVPALLWAGDPLPATFRVRGSHPVPPAFPGRSPRWLVCNSGRGMRPSVAPPNNTGAETPARLHARRFGLARFQLAATPGISVDFSSSGYLDVSVPPGCLLAAYIRRPVAGHCPCWVPPFGNPRIKGRLRLPAAYRSLPRPSSTSRAKASASRPSYLRPEVFPVYV